MKNEIKDEEDYYRLMISIRSASPLDLLSWFFSIKLMSEALADILIGVKDTLSSLPHPSSTIPSIVLGS
jgi:hypothetical protein